MFLELGAFRRLLSGPVKTPIRDREDRAGIEGAPNPMAWFRLWDQVSSKAEEFQPLQ